MSKSHRRLDCPSGPDGALQGPREPRRINRPQQPPKRNSLPARPKLASSRCAHPRVGGRLKPGLPRSRWARKPTRAPQKEGRKRSRRRSRQASNPFQRSRVRWMSQRSQRAWEISARTESRRIRPEHFTGGLASHHSPVKHERRPGRIPASRGIGWAPEPGSRQGRGIYPAGT